jgi:hypothetical protein
LLSAKEMLGFFKPFLYVSVFIFFQLLKDFTLSFLPGHHQPIFFDLQTDTDDLMSTTKTRKGMWLKQ